MVALLTDAFYATLSFPVTNEERNYSIYAMCYNNVPTVESLLLSKAKLLYCEETGQGTQTYSWKLCFIVMSDGYAAVYTHCYVCIAVPVCERSGGVHWTHQTKNGRKVWSKMWDMV